MKSPKPAVFGTLALKRQRSRPVAASSAKTRPNGVLTYIVPPITSGVASNDVLRGVPNSGRASPVLKRHATVRPATFSRVICASGE